MHMTAAATVSRATVSFLGVNKTKLHTSSFYTPRREQKATVISQEQRVIKALLLVYAYILLLLLLLLVVLLFSGSKTISVY